MHHPLFSKVVAVSLATAVVSLALMAPSATAAVGIDPPPDSVAGSVADDAPYIAFETTPVGAANVAPGGVSTLIDTASMGTTVLYRAVTSDDGAVLQQVTTSSGTVTQTLDVSAGVDEVTSGTASVDYGAGAPYPLNLYLTGTKDGAPVVVRVVTPGSATLGTAQTTRIETLDSSTFEQRAGVALDRLELLSPFSTGILAVYATDSGYEAKRLAYDLTPQVGRVPSVLPLSDEERSFRLDTYGTLYSSRDGAVDSVSLYDLAKVNTLPLPGVGVAATWLLEADNALLLADADGRVANIGLGTTLALRGVITLDEPAVSLAYVEQIAEIQLATHGATQIRRFAAADSTERAPLDASGVLLDGSLSSVSRNPVTAYLADIDGAVYSYSSQYVSSARPWFVPTLSAAERGAGVDFAYSAAGTGLSSGTSWFEYSLDDGAHWAKRGEEWSTAVANRGTVTVLPAALPSPQDGVAPYLRQTTDDDIWATVSLALFTSAVVLPAEQYDALWRYRVENVYGSVASESTTITIENEQEIDPTLRVTAQPTAARISVGEAVTLTASAAASLPLTVQWQSSDDGSVWTDIDGATDDSLELTGRASDDGRRFRAVFAAGDSSVVSETAIVNVMVPGEPIVSAAPDGAVVATDAQVTLDLSVYSHDWLRDTAGENVALGDTGFLYSGGTGWTDALTGETQLSWEGTAIYRPYGGSFGLYMAFANPHLAVDADGRGTLTAEVAWNNGSGTWSGPVESSYRRVIVATFADTELVTTDEGGLTLAGTPEWTGRAYSQAAGEVYPDSFPASFVDYLELSNRPWFYATGSTRDPEKAGLPVTATATVTAAQAPTAGARIDPLDPLGTGVDPFTPTAPTVLSQPQAVTIDLGDPIELAASASGWPTPSVQWQQFIDGVWTDVVGAEDVRFAADDLAAGEHSFRAVFTGAGASATTETAVVTVTDVAVAPEPGPEPELNPVPVPGGESPAPLGAALLPAAPAAQHEGATVLPVTGMELPIGALVSAGLLVIAGAFLTVRRRKQLT